MTTLVLQIDGMHCGSCALLIDDALADLPGVITARTSAKARRSTITHDPLVAAASDVVRIIEGLGYSCTLVGATIPGRTRDR